MYVISMLCRPFRAMFALIVPDGDFDLPKHLLIAFADRRAEGRDGCGGVEIKDAQKVFMLKPFVGLHVTPAHQGIRDADRSCVSELYSDVVIIVLFQIGIRNVVENVALMIVPVFIGELGCDGFKLFPQSVFAGNAVAAFQHVPDCRLMFFLKIPQPDSP
ncbi:MAG: hypothetical protein IKD62_05430 [Oscillospiraceae bacterium]|nr:hypothetical protein [Oscillospiraceae bacterium]